MKKIPFLLTLVILMVLISGCGNLSKEEIINKVSGTKINSFDLKGTANVKVTNNSQTLKQTLDYNEKYIDNPSLAYITLSTVDGKYNMYVNKQNVYVSQPGSNQWIKAPVDQSLSIKQLEKDKGMKEEIDRLKKYSDLYKLTRSGNDYILTVNMDKNSGAEAKKFVQDIMKQQLQKKVNGASVKVNSLKYVMTLSQNYVVKSFNLDGNLQMTLSGQTFDVIIKSQSNFTNINKVKPFSIPSNVVNHAVTK